MGHAIITLNGPDTRVLDGILTQLGFSEAFDGDCGSSRNATAGDVIVGLMVRKVQGSDEEDVILR